MKTERRRRTYESVVESGDENELAVGRELSEGNSRDLVVDESLEAGPGGGVPNLARSVVAAGDDEGAVAVEVDGGDGHGVSPNRVEALTGLDFPNANGFVEGTGDDEIGLGVEVDAENEVGVAAEGLDALAAGGAGVPDAESAVVGGGADVVGVGGPGYVGDALGVADEAVEEGEGGGGPDHDGLVEGGGGEEGAVVREFHARHGALVPP